MQIAFGCSVFRGAKRSGFPELNLIAAAVRAAVFALNAAANTAAPLEFEPTAASLRPLARKVLLDASGLMASRGSWSIEEDEAMAANQYEIEFIGGPFDGHHQSLSIPVNSLAETVALPVSRNIFRLLAGYHAAPDAPATSIAIYELEIIGSQRRYYFLGATSSSQPFAET